MIEKRNTLSCLLFATAVILAMMGYHLWMGTEQRPAAEPTAVKYGLVTGIFYTEDNPSGVVGGKIVHEGDVMKNVKVVRIYTKKVEFEKNNTRWSQRVQEKPSPNWWSKD